MMIVLANKNLANDDLQGDGIRIKGSAKMPHYEPCQYMPANGSDA